MADIVLKAPKGANKNRKKVGRGPGSGLGKTSGRGYNGQNARSGGGVRPGFEGGQMPLYRRIARRGFSNYPFKKEYVIVNLDTLNSVFNDGDTVSYETLYAKGLAKKTLSLVKILGNGEISKKLTINVDKISESALAKLQKAGCTIENQA